jgi:predicted HTH transcriptional regulator
VPYSSIESIIEQSKEGYYRALRRTQKTIWTEEVDYVPWISFFLTVLQKQKKILEEKVAKRNVLIQKRKEKIAEKTDRNVIENQKSTEKTVEKPTRNRPETDQKIDVLDQKILDLILLKHEISMAEIAKNIRRGNTATKARIAKLKQKGIIRREGPDKGGYWVVIDK